MFYVKYLKYFDLTQTLTYFKLAEKMGRIVYPVYVY